MMMKKVTLTFILIYVIKSAFASVALLNYCDKLSYTLGYRFATTLKTEKIAINQLALMQGLKDGFNGHHIIVTIKQQQLLIDNFTQQMLKKIQESKQKS